MSEVTICNAALIKLGDATITALADNSNQGRAVNARYAQVRDAELRRHRWRFSIARVSLAALATTPDSDFDRQFELPNDFIRLIEGGDLTTFVDMSDFRPGGNALFQLEGRTILTDLPAPLAIRYIKQVVDTSIFDSCFSEALASRLAYEICTKITGNQAQMETCMADYKIAIREAVHSNALELATEQVTDDSWIAARSR